MLKLLQIIFRMSGSVVCTRNILMILLLTVYNNLKADQINVLFLGNSYTYVNNLPQIIHDVALSTGDTLNFDIYAPGGYTLDQHANDSNSIGKIMQGGWDYVVLQEQSQLPSFPDYDGFGAIRLCWQIHQYAPCARTMFYMTWGRKNGDALNCPVLPEVCSYEGMDSLLRKTYLGMAADNNSEVAPVGKVWNYIRHNFSAIELYQPDESHPSVAGSYAAACTFYSLLFRKDPTLISVDYSLPLNEAADIRQAAKVVAFDSLSNYVFGDYIPQADFSFSIGSGLNEIDFWNQSANADYYLWDFGDGDTSTLEHPIHNYSANGTYMITLTAFNCDLMQVNQSIHQLSINICPHNPVIFPDSLILCQNASDTLWTQVYDSYQWVDNNGNNIINGTNQYLVVDQPGFYSVLTTSNGCTEPSPQVYVGTYSSGLIFYWLDTISNSTHPDTLCTGDSLTLILRTNKPDNGDGIRQWYLNNVSIPGANSDSLIVLSSGDYSIKVINPNCSGGNYFESPVITANFIQCNIGIDEIDISKQIRLFPNPSGENFKIEVVPELLGKDFYIINFSGEKIFKGNFENRITQVSISAYGTGLYFLKIEINGRVKKIPLIKIIN